MLLNLDYNGSHIDMPVGPYILQSDGTCASLRRKLPQSNRHHKPLDALDILESWLWFWAQVYGQLWDGGPI